MRLIKVIALLTLCVTNLAGAMEPISGDDLFQNSTNSYLQLSPNGELLSYIEVTENDRFLNLFDTVTESFRASVRLGKRTYVNQYYWLEDNVLLLDLRRDAKELLVVGRVEGKQVKLETLSFYGRLISLLPRQPDNILFSRKTSNNKTDLFWMNRQDFLNGNFDKARNIDIDFAWIVGYGFDEASDRLIVSKYDKDDETFTYQYKRLGSGDLTTFLEWKKSNDSFDPVHFIDDNTLAVLTNRDNDKIVLQEFDIATQELGDIIYKHEKYDLTKAQYSQKGELMSVSFYAHGLYQRSFFKQSSSKFAKRLQKTFPDNNILIMDSSEESGKALLNVTGAAEPGTFYLYSEKTDAARILMSAHPQLEKKTLVATKRFTVSVSENEEIEAFLTMPTDFSSKTLLVMPHGGPIGIQDRDFFNPEVQFYASRGLAILRANFRGSGGFGKAFRKQGVGQFGKLIEEDMMASLSRVSEEHSFENICAIGGSYGGYSSAMLAIKHPDVFDCVIASFGIFDLPLLFNESNAKMHEDHLEAVSNVVGGYSDDLKQVSPVYLAKDLKSPILILAGKNDRVANFEHSNRLKYVLEKLGHPVESLFYEDTGHGHDDWGYEHHHAALSYDFLVRTLNLSEVAPENLSEQFRTIIGEDIIQIADKYSFADRVENDEDKAFDYLQKAASFDVPRALFNVAAHYQRADKVDYDIAKALNLYKRAGELGFEDAWQRLGTLYMEGIHVTVDWQKAHDYLQKAAELDNEPEERTRLGRLLCSAPAPLRDIEGCLEMFDMKDFTERARGSRLNAGSHLEANLAAVFSGAKLNTNELSKVQNFVTEGYKLNHVTVNLDEVESGNFTFVEGEEYHDRDEYVLQDENLPIVPHDKGYVGLNFKIDVPGMDSRKDKSAISVIWYMQTAGMPKTIERRRFLIGGAFSDWQTLMKTEDFEEDTTLTVEIYDLSQNLIFTDNYEIKVAVN